MNAIRTMAGSNAETNGIMEELIRDFKDFKGFGALRLKLYLELSFRILKIILSFNFKLHFEPKAIKEMKNESRI